MAAPLSVMSDHDLEKWLSPITGGNARFRAGVVTVYIHAENLRSGALAVIALLQHTHSQEGEGFELPVGVSDCHSEGIEPVSFIDQRTTIMM